MRQSVIMLLCSLTGVLGGAALIGVKAIGVALIFDSLCVGVFALLRDDQRAAAPSVHQIPTIHDVLEKARGVA